MQANPDIGRLAESMAMRREEGEPGYLLFLGAECARAANVPTNRDIARAVFEKLDMEEPPEEELEAALFDFMADLSGVQRYRLLQPLFESLPVPVFYQDLASLIKAGYFTTILTTTLDSLLEQALDGIGLRRGSDYDSIALTAQSDIAAATSERSVEPPVTILRLHGALEASTIALSPEEIDEFLRSERRLVRGELGQDLVMVGYEFESQPLDIWLTKTSGTQMWWVAEGPDYARIEGLAGGRELIVIDGPEARVDAVFTQLAIFLLQLPVIDWLAPEEESVGRSIDNFAMSDQYTTNYLRRQVSSSQTARRYLKQQIPVGKTDSRIEVQLDYEKKVELAAGDELRTLSTSQERLLNLVESMYDSIGDASQDPDRPGVDAATHEYVGGLFDTVRAQLESPEPNQHILAATINAATVVGDRLGPRVVSQDVVAELSRFGYSGFGEAWS